MEKASQPAKVNKLIEKIKSIKHIEIIIGLVVVAVLILVFANIYSGKNTGKQSQSSSVTTAQTADTEKKLEDILSKMSGVGETKVMITYSDSSTKIPAQSITTSTNTSVSGGGNQTTSSNTTTNPIIITNNGVSEICILQEREPQVKGVIVVAQGADNPVTKLSILRAVQTLLKVDASVIEIFTMK